MVLHAISELQLSMGDSEAFPSQDGSRYASRSASHPEVRPLPFMTSSEPEAFDWRSNSFSAESHIRRKSTYAFSGGLRLNTPPSRRLGARNFTPGSEHEMEAGSGTNVLSPVSEQLEEASTQWHQRPAMTSKVLTPPITPVKRQDTASPGSQTEVEITPFNFSRIDYEPDRARRIGHGLWSSVYLAEPIIKSSKPVGDELTPPTSPQRKFASPSTRLFAVKIPSRRDAKNIFSQEGVVLTRLQRSSTAHQHIVSFHGLDARNSSLVFEGVIGGSLLDLTYRLQVMTEFARHLELRTLFPGFASDLISGLRFIHAAGIVHADIKPANVLLDITDDYGLQQPVLRARYIDFSASFVFGEDSAANAGGTWDFMAPEQLRIQRELNTPTFASDVWSLGISLLSIIVGGSPYTAACGSNAFMLREAIKSGDPLGFARMDPVVQKRTAACQDFVDCCRLALQKDRERRYTVAAWEAWLEMQ